MQGSQIQIVGGISLPCLLFCDSEHLGILAGWRVADRDLNRIATCKPLYQRVFVAAAEGVVRAVLESAYYKTVHRPELYVYVTMLKQFVIEVLLCKIGIECNQRAVFPCSIRKRGLVGGILRPVLLDLFPCNVVVGLRGFVVSEKILHIGTVHVGLCKVGIQLDCLVVVLESVVVLPHFDENRSPVEICKDIVRIDVEDPVHVCKRIIVSPELGADKSPVVEGQRIAGFILEHPVQIGHSIDVSFCFIEHYGPVEICESARGIKAYRLVHIGNCLVIFLL